MKPEVTFGDPEDAMIGYLTARWADHDDEPYAPVAVTNYFPTEALTGEATHLQVELDGVPGAGYPITEAATVRFTCWSAPGFPSAAKDLATWSQAFVYAHPGDAAVRSTKSLTGRLKGRDPDSQNNFVTFTARVNMRATVLT